MKKKLSQFLKGTGIALLMTMLLSSVVLAQEYFATVLLSESSGNTYTMFAARTPLNTTYLATNNYITATGLDTRAMTNSSTVPHMLADDKLMFAYPLPAYSTNPLTFYTGMTALSAFDIVTGNGGYITIADDPALEPGLNFQFEFNGWVDTSAGANKDLVYKLNAFRIYINGATNIDASITGGATVTAAGVASGEHEVVVSADGVNLRIYVDTVLQDTQALGGVPVPDNGNNWIVTRTNVMPYNDYYYHTVSGIMVVRYEPNTYIVGTTMPDRAGPVQNGTITWGTNPTGISITMSSLLSFDAGIITGELVTPGAAGEVSPPINMYPTDAEMSGTEQLFHFLASGVASQTDTPIQFFWWVMCAILIVMSITAGFKYTSSVWMSGFAGLIAIGVCISMVLLPNWLLIVAVLIVTGIAIMERTPSF